jgi:predicted ABC-type transport system involved in lysophospholipase L1 biosynthesis ATPase subunit
MSAAGIALGYEPAAEAEESRRIWIPAGGRHAVPEVGAALKAALLAATLELKPRRDARVVVLGAEVGLLDARARAALRAQVAFLPAHGGLLSNLNAGENIALPLAYHAPQRLQGAAARVYALLEPFVAEARALLARMPEEMTPFEKMLAAYARMMLGEPRLVLAEPPPRSLGPAERRLAEGFAAAFLAHCPEGTFVCLEEGHDEAGTMNAGS